MKKIVNTAAGVSLLALAVYSIRSAMEKRSRKRYTSIPCGAARFAERQFQ